MHALGIILVAVAKLLGSILQLYTYVIFGSVILSWVSADPYNPIVRTLRQLTEPVFAAARRMLPVSFLRFGVDLSPMIVLFGIYMFQNVVVVLLFEWGMRLR